MSRQQSDIQESYTRLVELQKQQASARKRARLEMLKLRHDHPGRSMADISREIGCHERSVLRWWQTYQEKGLDALLEDGHRGRPSQLRTVDLEEIRQKIAENGGWGLEEIRQWLAADYGLQYSRSGVAYILREILGARRDYGWILSDGEKPADSGDSLALDNPMAVIGLLNALPMTDDVVQWAEGVRAVLHRLLPDVDRITVNVNRSCDIRKPEEYQLSTRINRSLTNDSGEAGLSVATHRQDEAPSVRLIQELRAKGVPLDQFHAPVTRDYFFGGTAYLGTIFLWKGIHGQTIPDMTTALLDELSGFIEFIFSDLVARHQVMQPISGVFLEAAEQMFKDADLTNAERRIITLALLGHPYKEIADMMTVTVDAVKKHFSAIFKKTETRGQADLFAKYFTASFRREQSGTVN